MPYPINKTKEVIRVVSKSSDKDIFDDLEENIYDDKEEEKDPLDDYADVDIKDIIE